MIKFLEEIQIECLLDKYGENYRVEVDRLKNQKLLPKEFIAEYKDFYSLKDDDVKGLNEYATRQQEQLKVLNTKYSILSQNIIFDSLFRTIHNTVNRLNYKLDFIPYAGTAVSNEYNAFACNNPESNEKLIVFESELFIIANLFTKIISTAIPFKEENETVSFSMDTQTLDEHIENNKDVIEKFTELMYYTSVKGEPSSSQQYFIDSSHQKIHHEFLNSFELFVVGHEYGHIIAGHLNNDLIKRRIRDFNMDIIQTNWQEEFEADAIGLNLMINSLKNTNLAPFCYMGPELFFSLIDIDERIYTFINSGKEQTVEGSETHPPVNLRKKNIRRYFEEGLGEDDKQAYLRFSDYLDEIINLLWSKLKTEILNYGKTILDK